MLRLCRLSAPHNAPALRLAARGFAAQSTEFCVLNLDKAATEDDVRLAFSPFCAVSRVRVPIDRETGLRKGFAFVIAEANEGLIAQMCGAFKTGHRFNLPPTFREVNRTMAKPKGRPKRANPVNPTRGLKGKPEPVAAPISGSSRRPLEATPRGDLFRRRSKRRLETAPGDSHTRRCL
ncbi:hypothetical protein M885DRAFT_42878 [Pelagophyceae sp. CCMP2097]|nr:hypothetical protein M885DRAFT_42878 [Pelagophyceae sp. CCMP2097]